TWPLLLSYASPRQAMYSRPSGPNAQPTGPGRLVDTTVTSAASSVSVTSASLPALTFSRSQLLSVTASVGVSRPGTQSIPMGSVRPLSGHRRSGLRVVVSHSMSMLSAVPPTPLYRTSRLPLKIRACMGELTAMPASSVLIQGSSLRSDCVRRAIQVFLSLWWQYDDTLWP